MSSNCIYKEGIMIPARGDLQYLIIKENGKKKIAFGMYDFVELKDGSKVYFHTLSKEEQEKYIQSQNVEVDLDYLIGNNIKY